MQQVLLKDKNNTQGLLDTNVDFTIVCTVSLVLINLGYKNDALRLHVLFST